MKVLMVTPYPPKRDGIAVYAEHLVRALRPKSEVEILTGAAPASPDDAETVHRVLSANPWCLVRAIRVVRRARPDIMHFQYNIPAFGVTIMYALIAGVAARTAGTRVVFTLHEVRRELRALGRPARLYYRFLVRRADAIVVHTTEAEQLLVDQCRARPDVVSVMPHSAQIPESETAFSPPDVGELRRRYQLAERDVALCFGYIHPDKGIEHLIAAAAHLRAASAALPRQWIVLVAGCVRPRKGVFRYFEKKDRDYAASLQDAVERNGLHDCVKFTDYIPERDVLALITTARAVILPYVDVTQSGVLNLAIAAGTPVVGSDLPGLREPVLAGTLLVEPRDPEALADAIGRVLRDESLHRELTARQRACLASISTGSVAEQLEQLYRSLVPTSLLSPRP